MEDWVWLFYWVPVVLNLAVFGVDSWLEFWRDVDASDEKFYTPKIYWRTVFHRLIGSWLPVWNLVVLLARCGPDLWDFVRAWVNSILDRPLVRRVSDAD